MSVIAAAGNTCWYQAAADGLCQTNVKAEENIEFSAGESEVSLSTFTK